MESRQDKIIKNTYNAVNYKFVYDCFLAEKLRRGKQQFKKKDFSGGRTYYKDILVAHPDYSQALLCYGMASVLIGENKEAILKLSQLIEENKEHQSMAYYWRGRAYFDYARSLVPNIEYGYIDNGKNINIAKAVFDFLEACKLDPEEDVYKSELHGVLKEIECEPLLNQIKSLPNNNLQMRLLNEIKDKRTVLGTKFKLTGFLNPWGKKKDLLDEVNLRLNYLQKIQEQNKPVEQKEQEKQNKPVKQKEQEKPTKRTCFFENSSSLPQPPARPAVSLPFYNKL